MKPVKKICNKIVKYGKSNENKQSIYRIYQPQKPNPNYKLNIK